MKKLIKWMLNHVPRPLLQRVAGWAVPAAGLFYKGRGVECPVCGSRYRRFMPYGYVQSRANALCPKCLSLERHRLLWLYLTRETDLLTSFPRTLDLHFDVQQIPLADDSVDVILCNHLLEHVADDRRALHELYRILKPGGWGILLSPVEPDYEQTYEDDSITDPEERTRIFGQYDHRRIYGADYTDRLREAGFEAADIDYAATFSEAERRLYALPKDHIYVVYKH